MLEQIDRSAINNLNRIIFDITHEIENGNTIDIQTVIDDLTSHRLFELLDKIFGEKLNLDYEPDVIQKTNLALESVVLHDQDYRLKENGLLVLINAASHAIVQIVYGLVPLT